MQKERNEVFKPCRRNLILFDFSGHLLLRYLLPDISILSASGVKCTELSFFLMRVVFSPPVIEILGFRGVLR